MNRLIAFILCLFVTVSSIGAVHNKEFFTQYPAFHVLVLQSDWLYDPNASEDSDYPEAIPVLFLRGKSPEKTGQILKLRIVATAPVSAFHYPWSGVAPSQQGLYQRQEVLRI